MSSTTKTKPAARTQRTAGDVIDEFGNLDSQLAILLPRYERLKAEIYAWYEGLPPESTYERRGRRYLIQVSAQAKRREIVDQNHAFRLLQKKIGIAALIELVKIPLEKAVDQFTTARERKAFLSQERTGPRTIKAVPVGPVAV